MSRRAALLLATATISLSLVAACERNQSKEPAAVVTATPAAPDPVCQDLNKAIDESIRRAAVFHFEDDFPAGSLGEQFRTLELGTRDPTALDLLKRAARASDANNQLNLVRINLELQSRNGCAPRTSLVNPFLFKADAIRCKYALREKLPHAESICDVNNWKLDAKYLAQKAGTGAIRGDDDVAKRAAEATKSAANTASEAARKASSAAAEAAMRAATMAKGALEKSQGKETVAP